MSRLEPKQTEQQAFSARLLHALDAAGHEHATHAHIMREFNLRFPGQAVTVHAVRKWIRSEAIPTQEKLVLLAAWLGVRPDWLRFNSAPSNTVAVSVAGQAYSPEMVGMLQDLVRLTGEQRKLVSSLVEILEKKAQAKGTGATHVK